uniref:Uncharacterized protein n=1 Tax=Mucochytrium quahogii TaxID=96639 RepID=A0A7S2RCW8_9STRA|mmetsp:Transcript_18104/g.30839  ORF Transcript_18104/g.30839 Transcript_18104/m.30839 type:complete len:898 (+) Transcript_18104:201-2894(+)
MQVEKNEVLMFNHVFCPITSRKKKTGSSFSSTSTSSTCTFVSSSDENRSIGKSKSARCLCTSGSSIADGTIGREDFLETVERKFKRNKRQIRIYGPDGSGKGEVAFEYSTRNRADYPGGVIKLNGNCMLWDVHRFLVDKVGLESYIHVMEEEPLRERFWKYLYDSPSRWLLVIYDCSDDTMPWVPPVELCRRGHVLLTSEFKYMDDTSLRLELPLLSSKSTLDIILRSSGLDRYGSMKTLFLWSDSTRLCRNILGLRLVGMFKKWFDITFEELLERYDTISALAPKQSLKAVLSKFGLDGYHGMFREAGILDVGDFCRGKPWMALEGKVSGKDVWALEQVQEKLFRQHNRYSIKVLCRIWSELVSEGRSHPDSFSQRAWDFLCACSFFNSNHIPLRLMESEISAFDQEDVEEQYEDLVHFSDDETVSIHAVLLDGVRSIVVKQAEKSRALAMRILTSLHAFCVDHLVFPGKSFVSKPDMTFMFKGTAVALLPHVFFGIETCSKILRTSSDRPLYKKPTSKQTDTRHEDQQGQHQVNKISDFPSFRKGNSVLSVAAVAVMNGWTMLDKRRRSLTFSSPKPFLKQIKHQITSKILPARPRTVPLTFCDMSVIRGLLLLIVPLGSFRVSQAEELFRGAYEEYVRNHEMQNAWSAKYLVGHCLLLQHKTQDAVNIWREVSATVSTPEEKAFVLGSIGRAFTEDGKCDLAIASFEQSLKLNDNGLVAARTYSFLAVCLEKQNALKESVDVVEKELEIYDRVCPISFLNAEALKFCTTLCLKNNQIDRAIVCAEDAIIIYSSPEIQSAISSCDEYAIKGKLYENKNDLTNALGTYQKSLESTDHLFGTILDSMDNVNVLERIATCYEKLGQPELADAHYVDAQAMRERLALWTKLYARLTRSN